MDLTMLKLKISAGQNTTKAKDNLRENNCHTWRLRLLSLISERLIPINKKKTDNPLEKCSKDVS